ncbi:hypothetical protein CEP54_016321 [Fusarium duplospermum]|uniref:Uncharacterized protein n=1 Tax=Fusarium duplospermum TaxID=1325734 RepID=A0A428NFA0_9HYPO|nr:hypothetical protein CEP54_016321 [Fusarium duplospermum]
MDPPEHNTELEEFDYSLLNFDPDSLLDAWVRDLLVAGDHSAQHDQPVAMPPDNIFSNMDTSFGGNNPAFEFGPLDYFQISDVPQDCVSGLDPSMVDLTGVDPFSTLDPTVLQHSDSMGIQFSTGGGQNPPSDVAMEDLPSSSCTNLGDLQEEAVNISNGIVFPLQRSMSIGSGDFMPQTHGSGAARHIEHLEGQLTNAPGASPHAPPTSSTPLGNYPLNAEGVGVVNSVESKHDNKEKQSFLVYAFVAEGAGSGGGIPCGPCLKILGKSRIWATPCTKAQFLDIIEVGSSMPSVTIKEIALFKNPDIDTMIVLMLHMETLSEKEESYAAVIESVRLGQVCATPWWLGSWAIQSIFADLSGNPNDWTSVMAFCLGSPYRQPPPFAFDGAAFELSKDNLEGLTRCLVSWMSWVVSRYVEISLFRYLQGASNNHSFDSVEDQKSYIICLLIILLSPDPYPQSLHDDFMEGQDPKFVSLYRDSFDRRARVHSALWAYCSIAIRGLPAWTNIWETIRQRWPLIQGEAMTEKFHDSLTAFNAGLRDNRRTAYDSASRLNDYKSLLSTMYLDSEDETDFEEEVDDEAEGERTSPYKGDPEFYKLLLTNVLDDLIERHDQEATGGVLTTQTSSQKQLASTRVFAALAIIDWRRRPVPFMALMGPLKIHLDLLESFLQQVFERLACMWAYDDFVQLCPAGLPPEHFIRGDQANQASNQPLQDLNDDLRNFIRSGRRWNELKDMVGLEVVLMHDPLRHSRIDLQTFYIPSIVENGSERQFTRLKELIPTRLPWLAETCVKLRGLVPMLTAASITEHENAAAIQDEIQTMVTTAFGTDEIY